MKNEIVKAVIRLIVVGVLLINTILTAKGINPIPFDESIFTEIATQIAAGIGCMWVWWKNNNMTRAAIEAQDVKKAIKKQDKEVIEEYTEEA